MSLRKNMLPIMAMALMAAGASSPIYGGPQIIRRPSKPKEKSRKRYEDMTENERALHDMEQQAFERAQDRKRHDFTIHGKVIRALSKKDAIKKYNLQYGKKK